MMYIRFLAAAGIEVQFAGMADIAYLRCLREGFRDVRSVYGTELFKLVFKAVAEGELKNALRINSRYTPAEAYGNSGSLIKPVLRFDDTDEEVLVLSNSPNPFNESTTISFNMPEAGQARLTISDLSGKQVLVIDRTFAKGLNQVTIGKNQLPGTGVYFYSLTAENYSATRKMVLIH